MDMGYVIAALILLLIVAAGVTFFVLSAARRQRQAAIMAPDEETPLGDTAQHSDEQGTEGRPTPRTEDESGGPVGPESERLANRPR
jgi:hypothetical protein